MAIPLLTYVGTVATVVVATAASTPKTIGITVDRVTEATDFCTTTTDSHGVMWVSCAGASDPAVAAKPLLTIGANHVSNSCTGPGVSTLRPSATSPYPYTTAVCMTFDQSINASAYRAATLALYGSDRGWAENTASRLKQWGFNTAGAWSSTELENNMGLLFSVVLDMGVTWTETVQRIFPDVFDPAWAARVEVVAERECAPRTNNKDLLGYFPDNELNWGGSWEKDGRTISHSLLTWFLVRSSPTPGLAAATRFLQDRYDSSIDKLNAAWGTKASSWNTLGAEAPFPTPPTLARTADEDAFLSFAADRYHNITATAIRKADPNHMIIGYRYYSMLPPLAEAVGKYFDIVDYHAYSEKAPIETLVQLRNLSGLPVMVSEFGFRASDSGMPNTRGAGPVVMTQTERSEGYKNYISDIVKLPFLIGYHVFAWVDEPASGNGWMENSNYGMVHLDDSEYPVITAMYTALHRLVEGMHAATI